jgi:putative membrane protein
LSRAVLEDFYNDNFLQTRLRVLKISRKGKLMSGVDGKIESKQHFLPSLLLFFKGIAMGMGDSIPGVSGGTIAVITNIYEELIQSLSKIDITALKLFFSGSFNKFWLHINGKFLFSLALGVLAGLLVSANSILYLLENRFEVLMAFFMGLVFSSVWFLKSEVDWGVWKNGLAALLGLLVAIAVSMIPPQLAAINYLTIFFSGMVAICAMILPGLSGAFILLMLGVYEFILSALTSIQLDFILVFAAGCAIGLLSFTHLLAWLLKSYHSLAYSVICGMLLGSINSLWPWQKINASYTDSAGELQHLTSQNLSPFSYGELTGNEPYFWAALASLFVGFLVVVILHMGFESRSGDN